MPLLKRLLQVRERESESERKTDCENGSTSTKVRERERDERSCVITSLHIRSSAPAVGFVSFDVRT